MKANRNILILLIALIFVPGLSAQIKSHNKSSGEKKLFIRRINVGGQHYVDDHRREWLADQDYEPGSYGSLGYIDTYKTNDKIRFTTEKKLYQAVGSSMEGYKIDLPNGHYQIYLHFAEIDFKANNERVMDLKIEGKRVLRNLDIHSLAGHDAPLTFMFPTKALNIPVTDGCLDLEFIPKKGESILSAIEVIQVELTEPLVKLDPSKSDFGLNKSTRSFTITNYSNRALNWSIPTSSVPSWIFSIEPGRGTLLPGKGELITVQAKRSTLSGGMHHAKLEVAGKGFKKEFPVSICVSGTPRLKIVSQALNFGSEKRTLPLVIENTGGSRLEWSLESPGSVSWITNVFPSYGALDIGEQTYINVSANRKQLSPGEFRSKLKINTDSAAQTVAVKIKVPSRSKRHLFVDCDATGLNNGKSWQNAFQNITDAINNVGVLGRRQIVEIWVAGGTYYEHDIAVKPGIQLYGGFRGDETFREERQYPPRMYPTIIDGQQRGRCLECGHRTTVDGFVIQNGRVWKGGDGNGGGIYAHDTDVTIRNNLIRWNVVSWAGAAIFVEGYELAKNVRGFSPLIERNLIINNRATYCAAGIEIRGSAAVIRNNTIANNYGHGLEIQMVLGPLKKIILGDFDNNIVIGNQRNIRCNIYAAARKATDYSLVGNRWRLAGNFPPYSHGTGNIFTDVTGLRPNFIDPANGDYHLMAGSPSIDSGNPQSKTDPDQTRSDMGVFAYNQNNSEMVLAPAALDFGTAEMEKTIILKSYGAKPLNWSSRTFSKNDWITAVVPASGQLENGGQIQLTISVERAGMDNGRYSGVIAVLSAGESHEIPVEMIVNTLKPEINVSAGVIEISTPVGGDSPEDRSITINNVGPGNLSWSAALVSQPGSMNWLKLLNKTGFGGDELRLSFRTGRLKYGSQRQVIKITADNAANSPVLIPVIASITSPGFLLELEAANSASLPNSAWTVTDNCGAKCIQPIKGSTSQPNEQERLDYEFTVPEGVEFVYIFAEIDDEDIGQGNSYWIKVNNFDLCKWGNLHTSGTCWQHAWVFNRNIDKQHEFTVRPGKNSLNLFPRKAGGFINLFIITNDPELDIFNY